MAKFFITKYRTNRTHNKKPKQARTLWGIDTQVPYYPYRQNGAVTPASLPLSCFGVLSAASPPSNSHCRSNHLCCVVLTNIVACDMWCTASQIIKNKSSIAIILVYRMVVVGGGGGWSVVVSMLHLVLCAGTTQAMWRIVGNYHIYRSKVAHLTPWNKTRYVGEHI